MKKVYVIGFIFLAVLAVAGVFAMSYDLARINYGSGRIENRPYQIMAVEIDNVSEPYTEEGGHFGEAVLEAGAQDTDAYVYCLKAEKGYVVIFREDGSFYDYTDIRLSGLPKNMQIEILNTKKLYSQKALYEFLECYST